eukprot:CAMPEP_0116056934 /NCGR_PEP_ID=MMETSP0322-20121206/4312_1 /TAXON_ID=163516 /ORGANISM="Leptocylindrus danicus var. apora, Strain B651" /LENGTH=419 /DNA_ID=CAMNT_0003540851 /DNA_START=143 /DNA_END=1402 /DNA_ORIENTATION=+
MTVSHPPVKTLLIPFSIVVLLLQKSTVFSSDHSGTRITGMTCKESSVQTPSVFIGNVAVEERNQNRPGTSNTKVLNDGNSTVKVRRRKRRRKKRSAGNYLKADKEHSSSCVPEKKSLHSHLLLGHRDLEAAAVPCVSEVRISTVANRTRVDNTAVGTIGTPKEQIDMGAKKDKRAKQATSSTTTPWVEQYIENTNENLLPVPREFLTDGFNLMNVAAVVHNKFGKCLDDGIPNFLMKDAKHPISLYKLAHKLLLLEELPENWKLSIPMNIQSAAEVIFLLVHSRFACSPRGLDAVYRALKSGGALFGKCPRISCFGQRLLPCGQSEKFGVGSSMRYCCCCGEIFHQWDVEQVDGCAWAGFCHLMLLTYGKELFPELRPDSIADKYKNIRTRPVPQIFGFNIHENATARYPYLHVKDNAR